MNNDTPPQDKNTENKLDTKQPPTASQPLQADSDDAGDALKTPTSNLGETYKLQVEKGKSKGRLSTKALVLAFGLLVFVGGIGYGVYSFLLKGDEPTSSTQQAANDNRLRAVVTVVDGTAQYSDDGATWRDLIGDETLSEGQFVRTDTTSRVVLVLDDGSAIRLNNSTSVVLQSLLPDDVRVVNVSGEVYARVVPSERRFNVTAAEVDYTAKGTAYKTVNTETLKGVVVYQSTVGVSKTGTDVTEGKQYYELHPNQDLKDKITDVPLEELKSDAFAKWNLELDKQAAEYKDKLGFLAKIEEPTASPQPVSVAASPGSESSSATITLSGNVTASGLSFSWSTAGLNTKDGFKLVRSKKSTTPTYGKDSAEYIGGESTRSYNMKLTDGGTYYFRICVYRGSSGCDPYSNTIQLTAPYVVPEAVQPGAVNLQNSGETISWTFGGTAPHGFKLFISKSPNPTVAVTTVDKNTTSLNVSGKLSSGDNYIKVCKYTGDDKISGGITDCSNEILIVK